ncbi:UDP-N-acetylglucosamine 1-carboxyvinyltransferase [Lichenibacterium ramalinae]|uniref:UDP-N-acetylglucosamine 1-carboxyvinyltransferase n=1 Tax=Lichenibacterium ramalinae TaxID=2316527 RepID=A0A4Q2R9T2_9HYPH|nr:UDP-N-acetylglucosamine 1-carboxyvinyltransferase [Lichenibacterium ramalinae]RYB02284.1 UDP-N-acetylglucosamine 1-carboxyvinyltransferase [Lichenibacterium ramalinae]
MDRIRVVGGQKLNGIIRISGAKNAALPLMIASLLTDETLTLENVPRLADVNLLVRILGNHGVDYTLKGKRPGEEMQSGQTVDLRAERIVDTTAPYDLVSRMRASFWVIAPLLARMGECKVSLPGGCAIGTRPVDLLLMVLERLGASLTIENGYAIARAPRGLRGAEIDFPKVTVGGTHTALMAAALAEGRTTLHNAAREPEVVDLADCLNKMGARIAGAGTATIEIDGVARLHGARHAVLPDRIEAGTYAMAVAMTGGDVMLEGARADLLTGALGALEQAGATLDSSSTGLRVWRNGNGILPVDISTAPFPGFPTDLQAQFMALMTRAAGSSRITETIFENRFMHVGELTRFGARIRLDGDAAIVDGVERLQGAPVMATDLRASVSLVIAALAAEGETTVNRVYHLDRGFEHLEHKLGQCGAVLERISGQG